ncbi:amidohydrolase family protein [Rhodococcus artemisiae]|uniref:Amidohydrolase family protein n=1 Tax=Rhodococcus artemisiae TaxID=714159 RepID=A0ABU7LKE2_9NOCA|nr:amidohydrolase family protein [Rhodococcus artemisiae]MEE2061377.1 amidohydrolase family protein [Rhodococcus artemisiae]
MKRRPRVDVHQHLWPSSFVDALRDRSNPPRLDGWTLHLSGELPYQVDPADHSVPARAALTVRDGIDLALVSMSSALGIERLPAEESGPLLDAYHEGALALPGPFGVWAAANIEEPDPRMLRDVLAAGCVGLQIPATAVADPAGLDRCAPLLEELERAGAPLFVHPGPAAAPGAPAWWPAMVSYVGQMHTAWFGWHEFGARRFPRLRVLFAMLAGLAPLHADRMAARGGPAGVPAPGVYVETSSYGREIVATVMDRLGEDRVLLGSDRPYAAPLALGGSAGVRLRTGNPARFFSNGCERNS